MELSIFIAIFAGLVSFLSPCVLPIVPGFLAYLAGSSGGQTPTRRQVFMASVFFVLGFSFVFAILGVLLNGLLTNVAYGVQLWLSRVGGVVVILFGLYLLGLIKLKFLERDHKIQVKRKFSSRYVTSFVFGAAFAVGWTPCVGAALGAILALSATNPGSAFTLLFSYSIGLGLPFLILGAFASRATEWVARSEKLFKWLNIIFGLLLVALGVLVFTQSLNLIANIPFIESLVL